MFKIIKKISILAILIVLICFAITLLFSAFHSIQDDSAFVNTQEESSASFNADDKEYQKAMDKAKYYVHTLFLSKEAVLEQLESELSNSDSKKLAHKVVEDMNVNWNEIALKKAKKYADSLSLSKKGIYNQLISAFGERFSKEEAEYAINNLSCSYKENALNCAKEFLKMDLSKEAIYQQLISEYGSGFTMEEAAYAIEHLE